MNDLSQQHCQACEGGVPPLTESEAKEFISKLPAWNLDLGKKRITRIFDFKGYYKTIAFVNAIAWMAQAQKHHPDLEVSYNQCVVHYSTHAIMGLSTNDFICAAKVDEIFKQGE